MDVGIQIGQYKIIEHIGRGGMADVWSARDTSLGRMVAVKTIARDLSSDTNPVSLFEREAKTIANLEHPHILPIYGFGEFEGKLYIIMRYVTGGSLEEMLRQGALTYDDAVQTGRAIAGALDYAHSEKVIHLDLKPPNILMDSKHAPYLADFGLATVLGPEGRARNPGSGTLLYMAPEQLTSEELDHRADIYSFSLVIFHMLTGKLPFEGMTPLALKQIQFQDVLPHVGDLNGDLPDDLTDILRRGTDVNPSKRYDTVTELMHDVEETLGVSLSVMEGTIRAAARAGETLASTPFVDIVTLVDPRTVQQREAEDIYQRARQAWANGNGRFLLSVTHFMVMSDYYANAERHGLSYDEAGAQMLLRGALEYDYDLDHWWRLSSDNSRRWVCLHAIRSENAPTRVRAFYRLETLPDTSPPQIPRQVAQALSLENDEEGTVAALQVLGTRGSLTAGKMNYDVKTEFRGQLLNTIARDALQITSPEQWLNVTYSQEIDLVIAEAALSGRTERIRNEAARTIGKMRSSRAVRFIVDERHRRRERTYRTLAYILDEANSLPPNITFGDRSLAWMLNTWRRLSEFPMQIVWAFALALIGGWIGMGQHVYRIYRTQSFFNQQRISNVLAMGLLFGFLAGILTVIAKTLPERLRGFWPNWARLIWSTVASASLGWLLWWSYQWLFLQLDNPPADIMGFVAIGTVIAIVPAVLLNLRSWWAFLISVVAMYVPLLVGFYNFWLPMNFGSNPLLGMTEYSYIIVYDREVQVWTIMLPMVALIALGIHLPRIIQDIRLTALRRKKISEITPLPSSEETPLQPVVGPLTVSLERDSVASNAAPHKLSSDQNLMTALKPEVPRTEEFDLNRVGGNSIAEGEGPLDVRTEEFEVGKVGGKDQAVKMQTEDLAYSPGLRTTLKEELPRIEEVSDDDDRPDWDAIMAPLRGQTEDYEIGKFGGVDEKETPDAEGLAYNPGLRTTLKAEMPGIEVTDEEDDRPDWDAIMAPLRGQTEKVIVGDLGRKEDEEPDVEALAHDPNLQTTLKPFIKPDKAPPVTDEGPSAEELAHNPYLETKRKDDIEKIIPPFNPDDQVPTKRLSDYEDYDDEEDKEG